MDAKAPKPLRLNTDLKKDLQTGHVMDLTKIKTLWYAFDENGKESLAEDLFAYVEDPKGPYALLALPCPGPLSAKLTKEEMATIQEYYTDGRGKGDDLFAQDLRNAAALNSRWVRRDGLGQDKDRTSLLTASEFPFALSIVFKLDFCNPDTSSAFLALINRNEDSVKQFRMDDDSDASVGAFKDVRSMWDHFLGLRQRHNPLDIFSKHFQRMGIDCLSFDFGTESPRKFLVSMVISCLKTWAGMISGEILLDVARHPTFDQINGARFTERRLRDSEGPDTGIFRVATPSWRMPLYQAQWMVAEWFCQTVTYNHPVDDMQHRSEVPGFSPSLESLSELRNLSRFKSEKGYTCMQAAKSEIVDQVVGGKNILMVGNCLRNVHAWTNNLLLCRILENPPLAGHVYDLGANVFDRLSAEMSDQFWKQLEAEPRALDENADKIVVSTGIKAQTKPHLMCRYVILYGKCTNPECWRAHTVDELDEGVRQTYKSKQCNENRCGRGAPNCGRIHEHDEIADWWKIHGWKAAKKVSVSCTQTEAAATPFAGMDSMDDFAEKFAFALASRQPALGPLLAGTPTPITQRLEKSKGELPVSPRSSSPVTPPTPPTTPPTTPTSRSGEGAADGGRKSPVSDGSVDSPPPRSGGPPPSASAPSSPPSPPPAAKGSSSKGSGSQVAVTPIPRSSTPPAVWPVRSPAPAALTLNPDGVQLVRGGPKINPIKRDKSTREYKPKRWWICKDWLTTGHCSLKDLCPSAHGLHEIDSSVREEYKLPILCNRECGRDAWTCRFHHGDNDLTAKYVAQERRG